MKVNELIIQWLSQDKVFEQLSDDLACILNGKIPDVVPTKQINNRSLSPPHHKHPASPRSKSICEPYSGMVTSIYTCSAGVQKRDCFK